MKQLIRLFIIIFMIAFSGLIAGCGCGGPTECFTYDNGQTNCYEPTACPEDDY